MKLIKSTVVALAILTITTTLNAAEFSSGLSSGVSSGPKKIEGIPTDYTALENSARERLAQLLANGSKSGDVSAAAEVLDAISRSRYLSSTARLTEHVADLVDGFAPQLTALPDIAKRLVPTIMKSSDMPPLAVQVVTRFMDAKTRADAQVAVGDILRLIPAMEARDNARRNIAVSYSGTPEEIKKSEAARKAAGDNAFEIAFKASKASEDIKPTDTATLPK